MAIESGVHTSKGSASVRLLTSPEDLAQALARAEDFERRIAELVASRAERHEAALARTPSTSDGLSVITSRPPDVIEFIAEETPPHQNLPSAGVPHLMKT